MNQWDAHPTPDCLVLTCVSPSASLWARLPTCWDPGCRQPRVARRAICSPIMLVMDSCFKYGLTWKCPFSWKRASLPDSPQHTGFYWRTFSGLNSFLSAPKWGAFDSASLDTVSVWGIYKPKKMDDWQSSPKKRKILPDETVSVSFLC